MPVFLLTRIPRDSDHASFKRIGYQDTHVLPASKAASAQIPAATGDAHDWTWRARLMPLTIRQNARATRMTLRIEPGGRALKMTIPAGLPEREINAFLDRHQGWLMTKLARFSGESVLEEGGHILLRGVAPSDRAHRQAARPDRGGHRR